MTIIQCMARLCMILIPLIALPACGLSGDEINGKVIDEETNKPIPGATVSALWIGNVFALVDTQSACVHAQASTTDYRGEFNMPEWRKESQIGWVRHIKPSIIAHKHGYIFSRYENNTIYLKPFRGNVSERLEYLSTILDANRCGSKDESERTLHHLYNSMYQEAKRIAISENDKEIVDNLHYWSSFVLLDHSKPTGRDDKGRLINIDAKERK